MVFMPFASPLWLLGALSLALLGGGFYLIWAWYVGVVVGTAYLMSGVTMTALSFLGRPLVLGVLRRPGADEPKPIREATAQRLQRPDGTQLNVETSGPAGAPTLVFTHGWGTNTTEWYYFRTRLADRYRLVAWDLAGLGQSTRPHNHDYSLTKFANDLEAVVALPENGPVVLVGHSIGGMTTQTFCRLYPEQLGTKVVGLVLLNTTYTNPVKTTILSPLFRVLQKPLLEPLLHLTVWVSPLLWASSWLSYLNGTGHLVSTLTGFAGHETRGQLDMATRFSALASPAVMARGVLATFAFDETATLPTITVPTLVITGHIDRVTIPQASMYISQTVPQAELLMLEPAGHFALFEQHAACVAAVDAFGARCFSPGRQPTVHQHVA